MTVTLLQGLCLAAFEGYWYSLAAGSFTELFGKENAGELGRELEQFAWLSDIVVWLPNCCLCPSMGRVVAGWIAPFSDHAIPSHYLAKPLGSPSDLFCLKNPQGLWLLPAPHCSALV